MGNRHVWERYSVEHEYQQQHSTPSSVGWSGQTTVFYFGTSISFNEKTGEYTIGGTTKTVYASQLASGWDSVSAYTYPYVSIDRNPSSLIYYCSNGGGKAWVVMKTRGVNLTLNSNVSQLVQYPQDSSVMLSKTEYTSKSVSIKGDVSYGPVSSNKRYTSGSEVGGTPVYPTNGESGNYWYVYQGYDSIDASTVSYSTDKPERGEPITIIITPSTGKKYSGTVYYQYEYSIGSGWVKLSSKTTETSKTTTIPTDAKTFQARVLVSDDLGFTSTTYTTGAKLDVQSIQAYTGVNGTARRVAKMYIGVNGTAREVTGGYIGVNGTARKWF